MNLRTYSAGWLGAILLCLATAAQAQLIGNLANVNSGSYGGNPDASDNFKTGAVPVTVTSVTVQWNASGGGVNSVSIYTDAAGFPSGTLVGNFTNPNPTTVGNMSYTGSAALAANTTYWMVINIGDGSNPEWTNSAAFAASPASAGASMTFGSAYGDHTVPATWTADVSALKFAVFGAAGVGAVPTAPTLQEWALILLALLMAGVGMHQLRRRG